MIPLLLLLVGCAQGGDLIGAPTLTDGDTIHVAGVKVRLFGMDAPEHDQVCTDAAGHAYPCGGRAANALDVLTRGKNVRCVPRDTDRYGRTVAVCYVGSVDVGAWMVRAGWALAYRQYSSDYIDEETAARSDHAGLWAGPFQAPWDFRHGGPPTYSAPAARPDGCCRVCTNSQPCGDGCIAIGATCHAGQGCACGP